MLLLLLFFSQEAVKTSPNLAHEMAGQTMAKCIFGQQKTKNGERGVCLHCRKQLAIMSCLHFLMGWHERNPREIDNIRSKKNPNKCEIACCGSLSCCYFPQRILFPKKTTKQPFSNSNYQEPSLQKQSKVVALFISFISAGHFCGEILSRCNSGVF